MTTEVQRQLQQLFGDTAFPKILDTRTKQQFTRCRLRYSVNIELPDLTSSCFLLPDKHTPFAVIVPSQNTYSVTTEAFQHNTRLQDDGIAVYLKGTGSLQEFLTSRGWTVTHFLQDSPALWSAAKEVGLIDQQPAESTALATRCLFAPSELLASSINDIANELFEQHLSRSKQQQQVEVQQQTDGASIHRFVFRCLDVGCGSGRDLAWLASRQQIRRFPGQQHQASCSEVQQHEEQRQQQEMLTLAPEQRVHVSWHVTGVDEWLGALERAHELAAALQLTQRQVQLVYGGVNRDTGDIQLIKLPAKSRLQAATHASVVHAAATTHTPPPSAAAAAAAAATYESQESMNEPDAVQQPHSAATLLYKEARAAALDTSWGGKYDVILCVRFLERSLLPRLRDMLNPGGYILYSTFVDGPGLRAFGRPSGPNHVLQAGELARHHFGPEQGFTVVQDRVELTADGREVCWFISRLQA